ncbi:phospho-2-dehydro-3-deoxyheptonate aldolase [Desulfofarcimen acetoxidans DSM 771]|uniref:Phospho-2-dehydro-3-deoxyheptonate aldolase n=1 Tax=Desulfofarcimen acetoxidans (strain ATCC 49208 / DSM 771 / KCTC 5769 / VKM B-1644 / 5575) TaxID=485916 RepID=C8W331_DESAS|nr:3-deoxy-7-phosphoheptulonate synthase [Desulfofarcimen acetoxidans]ACV61798.1 phospho-2-dehydro-3-deoxyheptonate aldolase [Desulfofarcimen acetoxidans DSM 771]
MIIVMSIESTDAQIEAVIEKLDGLGFKTQVIRGVKRIVIGAVGDRQALDSVSLKQMPGVEDIVKIMKPFKMVSREAREENTVINIRGISIGGEGVVVMAGPCAVESREQLLTAARQVKAAGGHVLRGGAFKPRTSPYSFQGMEEEGLKLLKEASEETGLPTVTEVIDEHSLQLAHDYVDIIQIGARNMQNFRLLRAAGQTDKIILLKRGLSATIEEWLMSAEYIMSEGNGKIILCERGIRTFETYTRNTLDLSAVPLVKRLSHLPVIVDPSHATGDRQLVVPMSLAAAAGGADGLIVEMHPEPSKALCDGAQSLHPGELVGLIAKLTKMMPAIDRTMSV